MAYFRKERRTWTATWRQGGKKYTKGGFTSRRIAEMFENKKHIEKERRLVDLPVTDETTIEIVINRFLAHQKARKRPKAYRLDEMMSLNFLAYCNGIGHLYARHLDKEVLNQYIREKEITPNRRGKKNSNAHY